jgi:hypothetical protein
MSTLHETAVAELASEPETTVTAPAPQPKKPRRKRTPGPLAEVADEAEAARENMARLALLFDVGNGLLEEFDEACEEFRACVRRAAAVYATAEGWQRCRADGPLITVETEGAVLTLRVVDIRPT